MMAESEVAIKQRNTLGIDIQVKLVDGRELQVSHNGKKKKDLLSNLEHEVEQFITEILALDGQGTTPD